MGWLRCLTACILSATKVRREVLRWARIRLSLNGAFVFQQRAAGMPPVSRKTSHNLLSHYVLWRYFYACRTYIALCSTALLHTREQRFIAYRKTCAPAQAALLRKITALAQLACLSRAARYATTGNSFGGLDEWLSVSFFFSRWGVTRNVLDASAWLFLARNAEHFAHRWL